jgi:DNA-binding NarL/FixJ family response regulator
MPQGSGLDAVPAVLRISPGTQVLVLTACDEKEEHVRAFKLGAKGVIRSEPGGLAGRDENGLTERELEIVRLVASGFKNKEVGAQLTISERTVKTHLTNIFQKLGVRDRVGLVMYALRHGLTRAA